MPSNFVRPVLALAVDPAGGSDYTVLASIHSINEEPPSDLPPGQYVLANLRILLPCRLPPCPLSVLAKAIHPHEFEQPIEDVRLCVFFDPSHSATMTLLRSLLDASAYGSFRIQGQADTAICFQGLLASAELRLDEMRGPGRPRQPSEENQPSDQGKELTFEELYALAGGDGANLSQVRARFTAEGGFSLN